MPGYIIHLCIAKQYAKKYKIENEDEFIEGTIYPDGFPIKAKTHYSENDSSQTNLYKFLFDKKLDTSFNEGWFLHLLADYLFYNKYFFGWKTIDKQKLYNDYDILNKSLIENYHLTKIPKEIEKYFAIKKEGKTIEYHYDKVTKFIEEVSNYELHSLAEDILKKKNYNFLLK